MSSEPTAVEVGRVGRPHGLDGSFFVERASESPGRFAPGASLLVDGERARVASRKHSGGRPVIRLDRPVERGQVLTVLRSELPPPEPGSFYAFQLVGLAVRDEQGRELGSITAVTPGVANDVLELDSGAVLPLVDACVREIDLEGACVVIAEGYADPPEAA